MNRARMNRTGSEHVFVQYERSQEVSCRRPRQAGLSLVAAEIVMPMRPPLQGKTGGRTRRQHGDHRSGRLAAGRLGTGNGCRPTVPAKAGLQQTQIWLVLQARTKVHNFLIHRCARPTSNDTADGLNSTHTDGPAI